MVEYYSYLKSPEWRGVSKEVKKRAQWRCQACNSGIDLNAHHRTYEFLGDERNHMGEMICLCRRCHQAIHARVQAPTPTVIREIVVEREEVPPGFTTLTGKILSSCCTGKSGITRATCEALCMKYPPKRGWRKRLIGSRVTFKMIAEARQGKTQNPKNA